MKCLSQLSTSFVGAISCASLSTATSQSQCSSKFKLVPLLARRPRTLTPACALLVALTALPAHAQCLPPPAGLVAWWPGDGNTKDIISGTTGTLAGNVTYITQGKVSQAFSFSGSGHVRTPPFFNYQQMNFTIDAWVFPTSYPTSRNYVTIYADNERGLWLKDGKINWWSGPEDRFNGNTLIPLKRWTHIALTYTGGQFRGYVNGKPDGEKDFPGEFLPKHVEVGIGGHDGDRELFYGFIDEVEVFRRALDPDKIRAIFAAGSAGKCKPRPTGLTWVRRSSNPVNGTVFVGCVNCDPYVGDTPCTRALPLLCFRPLNAAKPTSTDIPGDPFYYGWSGGVVGTTPPYRGDSFATLDDANAACVKEFIDFGWRVAEHHDNRAGGWNFQAFGNVGRHRRFWMDVKDQPNGTCWLPSPPISCGNLGC